MADLLTAGLLVILLLATLWRPPLAYAAVVSSFAIEQFAQANGVLFARHPQLLNYMTGVIVISGILSAAIQGKKVLANFDLIYFGILALYGLALLSMTWAVSGAGYTLSVFRYAAPYIFTFALALPLVFTDPKDLRTAMIGVVVLGLFIVPALAFGTRVHEWGRTIESASTIVNRFGEEEDRLNPLTIATYAGVIVLICMTAHLGKTFSLLRYVGWALVPLSMYLIVRSGSRGQFLATLAAGIAVIKYSYPGLRLGRLVGVVLGAGLLIATAGFVLVTLDPNLSRFGLERGIETYMGTRGVMVQTMLNEWLNSSPLHLVLGLGASSSFSFINNYPHVQIVEILVELGFVGLVLVLGIGFLTARAVWRLLKLTRNDLKQRGAVVALMALILMDFILSFKQGSFLTSYATFFNLAILGRFTTILARSEPAESPNAARKVLSAPVRGTLPPHRGRIP